MVLDPNDPSSKKSLYEKMNPSSVKDFASNVWNTGQQLTNPIAQIKELAAPTQNMPKIAPPDRAQAMQDFLSGTAKHRQAALDKGQSRGQELFARNSLGSVNEGRSGDMSSVIDRLKSKSSGWSDPEAAARKEMAMRGIQSQLATNLRAGRANAGSSGLRGAIAQAQAGQAQRAAQKERGIAEQGLMVSGEDAARQGLQNYYTGLGGQEDAEQKRVQYNQGQRAKEKYGQMATELGYGSMGAGDAAAAGQAYTGQLSANLAENAAKQNQPGFFGRLFGGMFA